MADQSLNGAIAATRFGLGARPGEIDDASHDPVGWLRAQIRRDGADQPVTAPLPPQPAPRRPDQATPLQAASTTMAAGQPAMAATPAMADTANSAPPQLIPAKTDFGSGQPLPTMRAAWRTFQDYRDQVRGGAKGDPMLRQLAAMPMRELAAEEALARVRLGSTTGSAFRERWTLFWCNHFTVAAKNQDTLVAVGPFEREAIRPYVFKTFAELLVRSSSHPGMLLYLDQAQSIGPDSQAGLRRRSGLNENLAREIMELHTVGADAGYTQADVTEFARALTGWSIGNNIRDPLGSDGAFLYRDNFHEPGPRTILGKTYADEGGVQAAKVINDLARNPKTAHRLARKIATHFVADDPPPALVARLEAAWLRTGGDLAQVADALITAPEAFQPQPRKFKTPYEFLVSSYRAADYAPSNPAREVVGPLNSLGQRPFGAPQPNGWSDVAVDWAAPDAIVKRLTWAQGFADAHAPTLPPPDAARAALGARLTDKTLTAVSRAESRPEAFALLLLSPEFQRR